MSNCISGMREHGIWPSLDNCELPQYIAWLNVLKAYYFRYSKWPPLVCFFLPIYLCFLKKVISKSFAFNIACSKYRKAKMILFKRSKLCLLEKMSKKQYALNCLICRRQFCSGVLTERANILKLKCLFEIDSS
jgi:hypothetical protein